jgi:hypothetical protein
VERLQPVRLEGSFGTLHNTTHNPRCMTLTGRVGIGFLVLLTVQVSAEAQTYYYYPASVPLTTSATTAPRYYRRGLFGSRLAWVKSAPQYVQPTYTTQVVQTPYAPQHSEQVQTQVAQASDPASVTPVSYTPDATGAAAAAPAAVANAGDPYGFTAWLNATRATYGLPAVGYDPNLSSWAAVNNSHQAARGIGHFVMGPARRQNSAMGAFGSIGSMWMGSPAHRAALLDPTIRWIGIAGLGAYWTFNAN